MKRSWGRIALLVAAAFAVLVPSSTAMRQAPPRAPVGAVAKAPPPALTAAAVVPPPSMVLTANPPGTERTSLRVAEPGAMAAAGAAPQGTMRRPLPVAEGVPAR